MICLLWVVEMSEYEQVAKDESASFDESLDVASSEKVGSQKEGCCGRCGAVRRSARPAGVAFSVSRA